MNQVALSYKPNLLFRNGHSNTIFTSIFRSVPKVDFRRVRMVTHDEDFIDLDLLKSGSNKLAILCHGLEGSAASKYISGTADILHNNGYDICAMNYRYCSGEINLTPQLYHSGWTTDLHSVVNHLEASYSEIVLVGFSLGGNVVLKYVGDQKYQLSPKLRAICSISVPMHLHSSSIKMLRRQNYFYTRKFIHTLLEKLKIKHKQFPDIFKLEHIPKIKNVLDFDEYYTGPLNGFTGAIDYYTQCSSKQFLSHIEIPTLIVNAIDDPFLSTACFPSDAEINNSFIHTLYPKFGGHVGFYQNGTHCWEEEQILKFLVNLGSVEGPN